jgi:hypothetical protein
MEFADDLDCRSPLGRVDLPPGVSVTRMILLTPGCDDKPGAMEGVDRAEFVANIVVARAVRKVLPGPWHIFCPHAPDRWVRIGPENPALTLAPIHPNARRMHGRSLPGTSPRGDSTKFE